MRKVLLLFIMTISACLYSQDGFQYVTTSKDGTDYYYQISSHVDSNMGLYTDFWLKTGIPAKKIKTKSGKYSTTGGGYFLTLMRISCLEKTYLFKNTIKYDSAGKVIGTHDFPIADEPKPIVPNSVVETIYKTVCRKE